MNDEENALKTITSEYIELYQKDVESRFMEQCLDHCKGMIDYITTLEKQGKIEKGISSILQIIYILDYSKKIVGPSRAMKFLKSDVFSFLKSDIYYGGWNFDDISGKIDYVVKKIDKKNIDYEDIAKLWKELELDIEEKDDVNKKINSDMKYQYNLIGSEVDRERRKIVREIVDYEKLNKNSIKEVKLGALIFAFTKKCRNMCRHCMIRKPNCEPFVLTKDKIKETLDAAYDYGIIAVDCSGGEPLLAFDSVLFTVENAKMPQIFMTTSANVASNREQLEKIANGIWNSYIKNKGERRIAIQLSLDKFHQEVRRKKDDTLRENSPLIRIVDLFEILIKKHPAVRINIFTLRSKNEYMIKYFIKELKRRDINIVNEEEVLLLWSELTGRIPDKGMDILQTILKVEYNGKIVDVHCGVQSVSKLVYANLLFPWEYLGSPYSFDDFRGMNEADRLWMESDMLFVEADGNVFLGGHLEGAWSLGCLAEESMAQIIDSARFDPLIYYINFKFGQVVKWVEELESDIKNELNPNPTGMAIMHRLFGDPAMRLYLTKRILLEECNKVYPANLVESLMVQNDVKDLKNEYYSKKLDRNRYY